MTSASLPCPGAHKGPYTQGMKAVDQPRVLVVDDDTTVADVVVKYLQLASLQVRRAPDGTSGLAAFNQAETDNQPFDLVVLDLMLPGIGGLDVCRQMRAKREDIAVVMLTARGDEEDRILGLQVGADDYVTKPFSPRELVLRIQSVLRRSQPTADGDNPRSGPRGTVRDGDLVIDLDAHRVVLADNEISLTAREYDLLAHLLAHPGQAFSREALMRSVWEWEFGDHSTVTVHVRRLREKLEVEPAKPQRLVTVWGVGYRWEAAT